MLTMSVPSPAGERSIDDSYPRESVFAQVLSDIVSLRYGPGERLHVDSIARELDVSRTLVREALLRLASTRFVEVSRDGCTRVAEGGFEDMRNRLEVTGRLARIVLLDPRLDVAAIASAVRRAEVPPTNEADVRSFLDLAEALVSNRVSRVADYVLLELIAPLRVFFRDDVLQTRGLDLSASRFRRQQVMESLLDAAARGAAVDAERRLRLYVSVLAFAASPRRGAAAAVAR